MSGCLLNGPTVAAPPLSAQYDLTRQVETACSPSLHYLILESVHQLQLFNGRGCLTDGFTLKPSVKYPAPEVRMRSRSSGLLFLEWDKPEDRRGSDYEVRYKETGHPSSTWSCVRLHVVLLSFNNKRFCQFLSLCFPIFNNVFLCFFSVTHGKEKLYNRR